MLVAKPLFGKGTAPAQDRHRTGKRLPAGGNSCYYHYYYYYYYHYDNAQMAALQLTSFGEGRREKALPILCQCRACAE